MFTNEWKKAKTILPKKRLKDIIKLKGCQKSARIKKVLKNACLDYVKPISFSQPLKLIFYFFNIKNKTIILISKVFSSSSKTKLKTKN